MPNRGRPKGEPTIWYHFKVKRKTLRGNTIVDTWVAPIEEYGDDRAIVQRRFISYLKHFNRSVKVLNPAKKRLRR